MTKTDSNKVYQVYADKVRVAIILTAYAIIIAGLIAVVFLPTAWFLKLVSLLFAVLFIILAYQTLRPVLKKQVLYQIDKTGVSDFTVTPNVTVPWDKIVKIEMVPNNATFQIGIIGLDTVKDKTEQVQQIKNNYASNGNLAIYSIMIDGFKFRRKPFLNIYHELKRQGVQYNPQILINDSKHFN